MLREQMLTNHLPLPSDEILKDYRLAYQSRQASIIGRHEVLSGRAQFGIDLRCTIRRNINREEYEVDFAVDLKKRANSLHQQGLKRGLSCIYF